MAAHYREFAVPMTGAWVQVLPEQIGRVHVTLADGAATGAMLYSFNAAPVTGEGIPFGASNKVEFPSRTPSNAIYVKGTNASVLTVAVA